MPLSASASPPCYKPPRISSRTVGACRRLTGQSLTNSVKLRKEMAAIHIHFVFRGHLILTTMILLLYQKFNSLFMARRACRALDGLVTMESSKCLSHNLLQCKFINVRSFSGSLCTYKYLVAVTVTFTPGFILPGGYDGNNGEVVFGKA